MNENTKDDGRKPPRKKTTLLSAAITIATRLRLVPWLSNGMLDERERERESQGLKKHHSSPGWRKRTVPTYPDPKDRVMSSSLITMSESGCQWQTKRGGGRGDRG